jgi:hypothetical protein
MKIVSVFGRLLLSVSERLRRLASRLGVTDTGRDSTLIGTTRGKDPVLIGKRTFSLVTGVYKDPVLIWDVLEGPYHRDEFDDDELLSVGIDDNLEYFLVVKLQEDGAVGIVNFWVETAEEAYDIVEHFKTNIEPLEIT